MTKSFFLVRRFSGIRTEVSGKWIRIHLVFVSQIYLPYVYQKNFILGSFFWGYICTELPGGRLAEIIGTRRVFGYAMLLSSILTIITPWAADLGYIPVIILRVLLGFFLVIIIINISNFHYIDKVFIYLLQLFPLISIDL